MRPSPLPDKDGIAGAADSKTAADSPESNTTALPSDAAMEKQESAEDLPLEKVDSYGSFIPPAPLLKEAENEATPAAVQSLRMDGCLLRANVLEALGKLN